MKTELAVLIISTILLTLCSCQASRVISSLTFSRAISQNKFQRSGDNNLFINGMTGGEAAHELFIADFNNNAVRSFDTRNDTIDATDPYRAVRDRERVKDVAYSAESDTLFVYTRNITTGNAVVRSFARTNSNQWNESHRVTFPYEGIDELNLRILRDGTLFCGQFNTERVHVCRVHAYRSMQNCTNFTLPTSHRGFDVQRVGKEMRLAAALANGFVALFRVGTNGVQQLSNVPLADARNPLFVGDTLLVLSWNRTRYAAVSLSLENGGLKRNDRQLIAFDAWVDIRSWCFANGRLFAWDYMSKQIFIYE